MRQVTTESSSQIAQALAGFRQGLDFADALHLAGGTGQVSSFATFDHKLAKAADNLDCPITLIE